jgi:hypothetical protein
MKVLALILGAFGVWGCGPRSTPVPLAELPNKRLEVFVHRLLDREYRLAPEYHLGVMLAFDQPAGSCLELGSSVRVEVDGQVFVAPPGGAGWVDDHKHGWSCLSVIELLYQPIAMDGRSRSTVVARDESATVVATIDNLRVPRMAMPLGAETRRPGDVVSLEWTPASDTAASFAVTFHDESFDGRVAATPECMSHRCSYFYGEDATIGDGAVRFTLPPDRLEYRTPTGAPLPAGPVAGAFILDGSVRCPIVVCEGASSCTASATFELRLPATVAFEAGP